MKTTIRKTSLLMMLLMGLLVGSLMIALPVQACDDVVVPLDEVTLTFPAGTQIIGDPSATPTPMHIPGQVGSIFDILVVTIPSEARAYVCITYDPDMLPCWYDPTGLTLVRVEFIQGDVNRDGRVNWRDLLRIRLAICSGRWDPASDVNDDGEINRIDLRITRQNRGQRAIVTQIDSYVDTESFMVCSTSPQDLSGWGIRR